jgi:hypothetical protein
MTNNRVKPFRYLHVPPVTPIAFQVVERGYPATAQTFRPERRSVPR